MKIIARKHINIKKWDELVKSTPNSSFFSYSWYLDAVAENWIIIVNDDYTSGISLPYIERASVKILYTPIFVRYIEFLGDEPFEGGISKLIQSHFQIIETTYNRPLFKGSNEEVFQQITDFSSFKIKSQAERSLKKAEKLEYKVEVSEDYSAIYKTIQNELLDKFSGLTEKSMISLEKLFEAAKKAKVLCAYEVLNKDSSKVGGVICLENENSILYLKGAVNDIAKSDGGMYLALSTAIENAKSKNKSFDFGGSRIEGVQRFNHNLGGKDVVYYSYHIDNGPIWFKLARRIKDKWSKK